MKAFARAAAMFAAIKAAIGLPTDRREAALQKIGPYKSRGKGGKHATKNRTITGRWAQDRSKYKPAECRARGNR